ncbi:hypothetical protein F9U64_07050 [Gracilibacillus oryzae]|uniref:Uncharacterized protein n=1 Tax=Gracilibacillus oryzae TaxID=1672701 RepID=A0A7C8KTE7_9BACI|nr:hypothetical protein [Gracilibacillus oryzae]KAB8137967.1 hypothetical protein F9U64_07050 [Gracilibacillus oryzae]
MKRTWELIRFIRKSRRTKKQKLYKLAFGVALDKTIAIYLSFFLVMAFFMIYDQLIQFQPLFEKMQAAAEPFMPIVILGLFIRTIILSFHSPGILFTSAEYKMTTLPYLKQHVWFHTFIEAIAKALISFLLLFFTLLILTPISTLFLIKWACIIMVAVLLLILPQWCLYQVNGKKKILISIAGLTSITVLRLLFTQFTSQWYFLVSVILILLVCNIWLWGKRLSKVDWMRVIDVNDTKVWNMFFVNRMSEMEIKPVRKPLLQQLFRSEKERKPFPYHRDKMIFRKLWRKNLMEEKQHFVQTVVTIILCLVVLSFQNDILQGLSIVLAIFAFSKMSASYFHKGLKDKLIHSLPWNMDVMKRAYLYWIYPVLTVLGIILGAVLWIHQGLQLMTLLQFIHFSVTAYILLNHQLDISIHKINHKWYTTPIGNWLIGPLSYLAIMASFVTPFASLYVVFLFIYKIFHVKRKNL